MDFIKLRCFVALSKCLSFSLAAYNLNISQSSFSKHILSLEKELGIELFERHGKTTRLTESGRILAEYAQNILTECDNFHQTADALKKKAIKNTTVGITSMGCRYFWQKRLESICSHNPNLNIDTIEGYESDLINLLTRGELDYVIIRKEILPSMGFRSHLLYIDSAVVIVSKKHPLAQKSILSLDDLADEAFIFVEPIAAPHKIFKKACRDAGFEPNIVHMAKTELITVNYIQANDGIALYFKSDINTFGSIGDICMKPLKTPIESEIVLATSSSRSHSNTEKYLTSKLRALDGITS